MTNPKKIIWLTGMPRSGTNWLSQFFAASPNIKVKFCPLFSYAFKNKMSTKNNANEWQRFFEQVYITSDEFMDQLHLRNKGLIPLFSDKLKNPEILLIKSNRYHHLTEDVLKKLPEIYFISLVRNPLAVINSWLTNPTEFPKHEDPLLQWRSGECRKNINSIGEFWGFDDWKLVTLMHSRLAKEYPDRFFLWRYEDILDEPVISAKKLFEQLDIEFTEHVEQFISLSRRHHDDNPKSVYKSNSDPFRWRYQLDLKIIEEIKKEIVGTELEFFLEI